MKPFKVQMLIRWRSFPPLPLLSRPVFVATWRRSLHAWSLSSSLCEPASSSQMLSQQWGPKASLSLFLFFFAVCVNKHLFARCSQFSCGVCLQWRILCHRWEDDALCQENLQQSINTHTGHKVRVLHMQDYSSVLSLYSSKCVFSPQRRTCMITLSTQKWNQALVKMQTLWRALIDANRRWMKESHFLLRADQELVWKITEYGATQAEVKIICPLYFSSWNMSAHMTSVPRGWNWGRTGSNMFVCLLSRVKHECVSVYALIAPAFPFSTP